MAIRRIAILGATGSIGTSALSVVDTHRDRLQVVGLAAGNNVPVFAEQVRKYAPRAVALASERGLTALRGLIDLPPIAASGADGLIAVATHPDVDILLCASSGTTALEAVLAAIECGKTIALANKEVLVMAGGLVTEAARRRGVPVLPVDSEHNAIHQCLHGRASRDVRRLILTASGGPFRGRSRDSLSQVTAADALKHPTWQMGQKITIDSATLMNKGLEVIEAYWLFGVPASQIDVVVHPQSVVHSMVEFLDGSVIAQLGITDMRLPIQYAFSFPDRWDAPVPFLDLAQMGALTFEKPAREDFPCLDLAYRALEADRSLPIVLNAANEVAVASFLEGRLRFTAIPEVIVRTMDAHHAGPAEALRDVRRIDTWARAHAEEAVRELQST
jgi:1-deoxy-D-xylulose-5-phosphate reductoisomerase